MRPATGDANPRSGAAVSRTAGEAKSAGLVIGPDGAAVRHQVGPMAWCVLETLAASPFPGDGDTVVLASVRSLAIQLGVGKNTVHRALVKLRTAGLLEGGQRRAESGRFDAGFCRLLVPASVLALAARDLVAATSGGEVPAAPRSVERPLSALAPAARGGRSRSRRPAAGVAQLSLPGV